MTPISLGSHASLPDRVNARSEGAVWAPGQREPDRSKQVESTKKPGSAGASKQALNSDSVHQQGTNVGKFAQSFDPALAFGPNQDISALTRHYDSQGRPIQASSSALELFKQPSRGLNILA